MLSLFAFICACGFLSSCARSQPAIAEAPPAYQPAPPGPLPDVPKLPAKSNEVQDAVKRVFKGAAVLDTGREPNFIAGDFNGDHSQDLAVVIRPAPGKLAEMNDEFPAWIVKNPFALNRMGTAPLKIQEDEVLLAVIHGYGPNDWRDPQATQTFLLKNAVGSGIEVRKQKDFLAANSDKKVPHVQGDVIGEVIGGEPGYLYFAGATYAWYDPLTFREEPVGRLVHPGITPKSDK